MRAPTTWQSLAPAARRMPDGECTAISARASAWDVRWCDLRSARSRQRAAVDRDSHREAPAGPAGTLSRMRHSSPSGTRSVAEALQGHETLGALLGRWRIAQQCMQASRPVMGAALSTALRPGPIEDGCWVILADNGTAASKARQLLPRVSAVLQQAGMPVSEVKVRVVPRPAQPPGGQTTS